MSLPSLPVRRRPRTASTRTPRTTRRRADVLPRSPRRTAQPTGPLAAGRRRGLRRRLRLHRAHLRLHHAAAAGRAPERRQAHLHRAGRGVPALHEGGGAGRPAARPRRSCSTRSGCSSRRGCTPTRSGSPSRSCSSPWRSSSPGRAFSHYMVFPWAWQFFAGFTTDYMQFMPRIQPVSPVREADAGDGHRVPVAHARVLPGARRAGHAGVPRPEHQIRHPRHLHRRRRDHAHGRPGDAGAGGGPDVSRSTPSASLDRLGLPEDGPRRRSNTAGDAVDGRQARRPQRWTGRARAAYGTWGAWGCVEHQRVADLQPCCLAKPDTTSTT